MARLQFRDPFEHGLGCNSRPECEGLGQPCRIEGSLDRCIPGKDCLDLAGEPKLAASFADEQGPNPETVPRQRKGHLFRIPDREGELAVEALERPNAPTLVGMQDDFRIALSPEHVSHGPELSPQLHVIEDLTVEHHPQPARSIAHRLLPRSEVDDRQACVAQCGVGIAIDTGLVGAAVLDRPDHGIQVVEGQRRATLECDSASYPTHAQSALSARECVETRPRYQLTRRRASISGVATTVPSIRTLGRTRSVSGSSP